jgi:hypothetical protein
MARTKNLPPKRNKPVKYVEQISDYDLLKKQENESGPHVRGSIPPADGRKKFYDQCFCCKKTIQVGQEYYSVVNATSKRRHTTCKRTKIGLLDKPEVFPRPQVHATRKGKIPGAGESWDNVFNNQPLN